MSMSDGGILGTELYHRAVPKELRNLVSLTGIRLHETKSLVYCGKLSIAIFSSLIL